MTTEHVPPFEVDGFLVFTYDRGDPVDLIASTRDGRMRDKVEMGLLRRVDPERFYVADTRWST